MRLLLSALILAATVGAVQAQSYGGYGSGSNSRSHYVQPHVRSDGGFTDGHYRTNPNSTQMDNYETRGNYNPHNGQVGRRNGLY